MDRNSSNAPSDGSVVIATPSEIAEHKRLSLELKNSKRLPKHCIDMPLKIQYLNEILKGSKTVEGRINTGFPARCRKGDFMLFFSHDNCCMTRVVEKSPFKTFREMLSHCGVQACLPEYRADDVNGAVRLYHSIPQYQEKESRFGVLGIKIQRLSLSELRDFHRQCLSGSGRDGSGAAPLTGSKRSSSESLPDRGRDRESESGKRVRCDSADASRDGLHRAGVRRPHSDPSRSDRGDRRSDREGARDTYVSSSYSERAVYRERDGREREPAERDAPRRNRW